MTDGDDDLEPVRLRDVIEAACDATGRTLRALTAMSEERDPYRRDTPRRRHQAEWLADLLPPDGVVHVRGLHYALIGSTLPDGRPYLNTDAQYLWLSDVSTDARWLGVVPFSRLVDRKNEAPSLLLREPLPPMAGTAEADLPYVPEEWDYDPDPTADSLRPRPRLTLDTEQPYRLCLFGEKSSLSDFFTPYADQCDLMVSGGDPSDTHLYDLAVAAAEDPRPLVILTFTDCDPRGWSMPIVIARKMAAFKDAYGLDLDYRVVRVALTPEWVRQFNADASRHGEDPLPTSPLKRPNPKWVRLTGMEQTEIDVLAARPVPGSGNPDRRPILRALIRDAVAAWTDPNLAAEAQRVRVEWEAEAADAIADLVDADDLADLAERLTEAREVVRQAVEDLQAVTDEADERLTLAPENLPDLPDQPQPEVEEPTDVLVSSEWSWVEQTDALIASRDQIGGLDE